MSGYFRPGVTHKANEAKPAVAADPVISGDPVRELSLRNVGSYLNAEASLHLHGPVSDAVFADRKAKCLSCPSRKVNDKIPDEIGFCSSCGCGVSERSRLTVKLTMPEASCPLKKWDKAPGRHKRLIDRVKAWLVKRIIGVR